MNSAEEKIIVRPPVSLRFSYFLSQLQSNAPDLRRLPEQARGPDSPLFRSCAKILLCKTRVRRVRSQSARGNVLSGRIRSFTSLV